MADTPFLDEPEEKHPSFGVAGFSRRTGGNFNLFGSSIKHGNTICLTIKRASRRRSLSNYWIHGNEQLIEVLFSPNQFAQLLTSMNVGDGVPCTLQYVGRERMPDCPSVEIREEFQREFEEDVRKVTAGARTALKEITQIFNTKASIGKADRAEILSKINRLINLLTDSIPFVQGQFNEAMDGTVTEARAEVESFIDNKIQSLGIQALNDEVQKALAATRDSPVLQIEAKEVIE
jgi:hypothetical protein